MFCLKVPQNFVDVAFVVRFNWPQCEEMYPFICPKPPCIQLCWITLFPVLGEKEKYLSLLVSSVPCTILRISVRSPLNVRFLQVKLM